MRPCRPCEARKFLQESRSERLKMPAASESYKQPILRQHVTGWTAVARFAAAAVASHTCTMTATTSHDPWEADITAVCLRRATRVSVGWALRPGGSGHFQSRSARSFEVFSGSRRQSLTTRQVRGLYGRGHAYPEIQSPRPSALGSPDRTRALIVLDRSVVPRLRALRAAHDSPRRS